MHFSSIFFGFQKNKQPENELSKIICAVQKAFDQANGIVDLSFKTSEILINKLPYEFEELKNLVWITPAQEITSQLQLYMSRNSLAYFPKEILNLRNLTVLVFKQNLIKFLPPEIGQLSNLRELAVSNNLLEFLPWELFNLKKLELFVGQPNPYLKTPAAGVVRLDKPELQLLTLKELCLRTIKNKKVHIQYPLLGKHQGQLHFMDALHCPNCMKYIWESQVKTIMWLRFPPSGQIYPFQFRFCSNICRFSLGWENKITKYCNQFGNTNTNLTGLTNGG